eukprot:656743-Pyramimonas_sp.AAC.1
MKCAAECALFANTQAKPPGSAVVSPKKASPWPPCEQENGPMTSRSIRLMQLESPKRSGARKTRLHCARHGTRFNYMINLTFSGSLTEEATVENNVLAANKPQALTASLTARVPGLIVPRETAIHRISIKNKS